VMPTTMTGFTTCRAPIERASLAGRALSVAGLEADFIYPLFQQAHRMARTVTVRNGTCPMA
jgi:hypothetical protein